VALLVTEDSSFIAILNASPLFVREMFIQERAAFSNVVFKRGQSFFEISLHTIGLF